MVKYWEILQLSDSTFVLQNSDESDSPVVKIEFSEDARKALQEQLPEVARAMISSGMESAGMLVEGIVEEANPEEDHVFH
jgi:hypothetical protein